MKLKTKTNLSRSKNQRSAVVLAGRQRPCRNAEGRIGEMQNGENDVLWANPCIIVLRQVIRSYWLLFNKTETKTYDVISCIQPLFVAPTSGC